MEDWTRSNIFYSLAVIVIHAAGRDVGSTARELGSVWLGVVFPVPRRRSTNACWWRGWMHPQQHSEALGVPGKGHIV